MRSPCQRSEVQKMQMHRSRNFKSIPCIVRDFSHPLAEPCLSLSLMRITPSHHPCSDPLSTFGPGNQPYLADLSWVPHNTHSPNYCHVTHRHTELQEATAGEGRGHALKSPSCLQRNCYLWTILADRTHKTSSSALQSPKQQYDRAINRCSSQQQRQATPRVPS